MANWLLNNPGRIFVVATFLPLAAFVLLLMGGLIRSSARSCRHESHTASFLFYLFGGQKPLRAGAIWRQPLSP